MSIPGPFADRYRAALDNETLSQNLLEFQRSWRETRDKQITDLEEIVQTDADQRRHELAVMKDHVIEELSEHVKQFRVAAEATGAIVFEAGTAAEANDYIARLCT